MIALNHGLRVPVLRPVRFFDYWNDNGRHEAIVGEPDIVHLAWAVQFGVTSLRPLIGADSQRQSSYLAPAKKAICVPIRIV
jgi:hypothetical protein